MGTHGCIARTCSPPKSSAETMYASQLSKFFLKPMQVMPTRCLGVEPSISLGVVRKPTSAQTVACFSMSMSAGDIARCHCVVLKVTPALTRMQQLLIVSIHLLTCHRESPDNQIK